MFGGILRGVLGVFGGQCSGNFPEKDPKKIQNFPEKLQRNAGYRGSLPPATVPPPLRSAFLYRIFQVPGCLLVAS